MARTKPPGPAPMPESVYKLGRDRIYGKQRDRIDSTPKAEKVLEPRCPKKFIKEERKIWNYYKKILRNFGLFDISNGPILELLCVNLKLYNDCLEDVRKNGMITIKNDVPYYNKNFDAMNRLEGHILKYLQELGLSSAGMARLGQLTSKKKKKQEGMEKLID